MNRKTYDKIVSSSNWLAISPAVKSYLRQILKDKETHGLYLNTLSYIEHLGSRYLLASHQPHTLDSSVMKHFLEEVRHSFALRKMAEKVSRRSLTYQSQDLLAQPAARMYFGRLAAMVRKNCWTKGSNFVVPALYFSAAVEVRALWLYAIHEEMLKENKIGVSFAGVLGEEEKHLDLIFSCLNETTPEAEEAFLAVSDIECQLFSKFFLQLPTAAKGAAAVAARGTPEFAI